MDCVSIPSLVSIAPAGAHLRSASEATLHLRYSKGDYTQGDSDVISMPAGFRRHVVGKTLINVFHCDIAEIRFFSKLVIIQTFS